MNLCLNTQKEYDPKDSISYTFTKKIVKVILCEIKGKRKNIIILEECTPNLITRL